MTCGRTMTTMPAGKAVCKEQKKTQVDALTSSNEPIGVIADSISRMRMSSVYISLARNTYHRRDEAVNCHPNNMECAL